MLLTVTFQITENIFIGFSTIAMTVFIWLSTKIINYLSSMSSDLRAIRESNIKLEGRIESLAEKSQHYENKFNEVDKRIASNDHEIQYLIANKMDKPTAANVPNLYARQH